MKVMRALAIGALLAGSVVAAAGPAQAAPPAVHGYVWGNQPASPNYFPNTGYEHNSAGGSVQIVRNGVGSYHVVFHGMAANGGVAHASAYGNDHHCTTNTYGPRRDNQVVHVRCFEPTGAPADSRFVAHFTNHQPAGGSFGYLRNDRAVPDPGGYQVPAPWSYDSAGQPVVVHHTAVGQYEVELGAYLQDSAGEWRDGFLRATPLAAAARHCQLLDPDLVPDNTRLHVRCYDHTGFGVDTAFTLTYARGVSPVGTQGGYATATVERILGFPEVRGWSNTISGGGALATDLDFWSYLVTFRGTAEPRGHAIASIMGTPPQYCNIQAWWTDGEHQRVWLRCYQKRRAAPGGAVQRRFRRVAGAGVTYEGAEQLGRSVPSGQLLPRTSDSSGAVPRDPVGGGEHLAADRLYTDLGQQQAGRHPLDHAPLPDRRRAEASLRRQPPGPLVWVAGHELDRSSRIRMPRSYSGSASSPSGSTSLKPPPAASAFHSCTSPCTSTARSSSCAAIRRSAHASA